MQNIKILYFNIGKDDKIKQDDKINTALALSNKV